MDDEVGAVVRGAMSKRKVKLRVMWIYCPVKKNDHIQAHIQAPLDEAQAPLDEAQAPLDEARRAIRGGRGCLAMVIDHELYPDNNILNPFGRIIYFFFAHFGSVCYVLFFSF